MDGKLRQNFWNVFLVDELQELNQKFSSVNEENSQLKG